MNNLFTLSWNFFGRKNSSALVTARWNIPCLAFSYIVIFSYYEGKFCLECKLCHHFIALQFFSNEWSLAFEPQVQYPGSEQVTQKMFSCCVYWDALVSCPDLISFIFHIYANCEFSWASLSTFHLLNDCVLLKSQVHWVIPLWFFYLEVRQDKKNGVQH